MDAKKKIVSTTSLLLLILLVVGGTLAYFNARGDDEITIPAKIQTQTTDSLLFTVGNPIALTANPETFAQGLDNSSGTSFAKATLRANATTNTAADSYNLYLDVTNNDLIYTTDDKKPELLLKITDPEGNELKTIEGLEYKSVVDGKGVTLSGFDLTTFRGPLLLVDNYEIATTSIEEQTWNIEVIFVNLDSNQSDNGGKPFRGALKIQKGEMQMSIAEICKNQQLGYCLAQNYSKDKNIYYHSQTLTYGAGDGSYRYAGANPNNYICFGMDGDTCDDDHLYRIIGVFGNQLKLIKSDFATTTQLGTTEQNGSYTKSDYPNYKGVLTQIPIYYWSGSSSNKENTWATSTLNTNALNKVFLESFDATWQGKIATTKWKVGGNTDALIRLSNAQIAYINEVTSPATGQTAVSNKIGLMYVSDYYYAASPTYWINSGYNSYASKDYRAATGSNWMYSGVNEWSITRRSNTTYDSFFMSSSGIVSNTGVYTTHYGVRPVFSLSTNNYLKSGDGTKENPYILNK